MSVSQCQFISCEIKVKQIKSKENPSRLVVYFNSFFRLAERNCHEVVSKLVELGLIQVLYTSDGKTYLTPKELEKEIYEELLANEGEN